jgi:undecaprenyl diphosphate synthase
MFKGKRCALANTENVPRHVAIIMDGNGRWARQRLLRKSAGHRAGAQALRKLAEGAEKLGIKYLTAYAFSTENWERPQDEVDTLMDLIKEYIQQYIDDVKKNDMRLSVIGDITRLSPELQRKIKELERLTIDKPGMRIIIALNYGGRDEITRAVRKLAADVLNSKRKLSAIDADMFASYLDTAGIPDPDLLIRTSGELRISNFLLWQLAYTEMYFTDKLWPDFTIRDLQAAIDQYQHRDRRFGRR